MIAVWRIGHCPDPQPPSAVLINQLGYGSTLGNGRWHTRSPLQVVYAGSSRAICQLEKRVHSNGANPSAQALMRLELPDSSELNDVKDLGLPSDWRTNEAATQSIGNAWIASVASLGMWVPSFIEPSEAILMLIPAHPLYRLIALHIERNPFRFDPRLF